MERMKMFFMLVSLLAMNFAYATDPIENFKSRSYFEEAQNKAATEGKLLFIDFYAKWCTPCKWMEETTFKDERIQQKLQKDYITLKVDIDDMEGFELKSKFGVQYLPTILIFNLEGKMIERIEETLAPSKLLGILNNYEASASSQVSISHPLNTSPKEISYNEANKNTAKDDVMLSNEEYRKYFENQDMTPKKDHYQMQLGVYANFDGAERKIAELSQQFVDEFIILEDTIEGKQLFRVMMGNFTSLEDAQNFKKILKEQHQVEALVK